MVPGEFADEGDAIRSKVEQQIRAGEMLSEPDGYYSFPLVLGTAYTRTGRMEILGYYPSLTHGPMDKPPAT